jgi:hypothetical protein
MQQHSAGDNAELSWLYAFNPSLFSSAAIPQSRSPRLRAFSSREILPQSGFDPFQGPIDLILSDHKRRCDADRVFMGVLGKNASAL